MKSITSAYHPDWKGKSMATISSLMFRNCNAEPIDSLNWADQYPTAPTTTFSLAHTDKMLYVRFCVVGEEPLSTKTNDLELVNEDACVEMFIGNANNTRYWNFEFNPVGVCNASCRKERKVDVVRLNPQQLTSIKRLGQQLGNNWILLVGITLSLIEFDPLREHSRRANFYKCGDKTAMKHYASWNPIEAPAPAFHLPEFFGEIQF